MRRWQTARLAGGFTLVELLVVMAVLGVLSALLLPMAEVTVQRERERELKLALREIRSAIDAYHDAVKTGEIVPPANESGYPPSLQDLVQGGARLAAGTGHRHFLRRVPRDPFAEPEVPAELTWALRSFDSPADAPRPGVDVYDVASRSARVGLNGVPLKDW